MDASDESLIRSIERGDKAAMRRLYERHAGDLTAFVRSRLNDPVEAADVVQDTFLEIWLKAGRFEARSSVRSWMYSIARNKAVDRIRKLSRTVVSEPDDRVPDDAPDLVAVIENAEDARRVRNCLNDLSDAQRAAVILAFYEEMTYREIAEVENVSEGTVKSRIFHAKQRLMRCLSR